MTYIFIRKTNKKERSGTSGLANTLRKLSEELGCPVVYKPYGTTGNREDAGLYKEETPWHTK